MRSPIQEWPSLVRQDFHVFALESPVSERGVVLEKFRAWSEARSLPLYYWNPGYQSPQEIIAPSEKLTFVSSDTFSKTDSDWVQSLLGSEADGVIILEGVLEAGSQWNTLALSYQLLNLAFELKQRRSPRYFILMGETLELPSRLDSVLPTLYLPLPHPGDISEILSPALGQLPDSGNDLAHSGLVKACLGLPAGELEAILERSQTDQQSIEQLKENILTHKLTKLKGRGLEFISEPDVPVGGLDLLEDHLNRSAALLSPAASEHNLSFPKGIILWGPPGTGKSLSAKHAAKKMGVPLIAADWGGLISNVPGESEANLRFLLELVEITSPCVLYWDDFDKAFAGWDSDAGGGVQRRLSGKLLTWMQERTAPVFVIATVNRLGMLPAELNRRFDDIFFVDLPHAGARKAIFDIHLTKYAPQFDPASEHPSPFTLQQWHLLLREYNLCSAAEIANAVRKSAEEAFYLGRPQDIRFDDLIEQRRLFTPAMIREEEQILAIRKRATYARPASSPDKSTWKVPPSEMFEFLRK